MKRRTGPPIAAIMSRPSVTHNGEAKLGMRWRNDQARTVGRYLTRIGRLLRWANKSPYSVSYLLPENE